MNYKEASEYWVKKDAKSKRMEEGELLKKIDEFLLSHNTMALATGYGEEVRCTPIEYNYYDGYFYLYSEGGLKFKYLEKNKNVAGAIYEPYTGFSSIYSLQIEAVAEVVPEDSDEFAAIAKRKGINLDAIKKMNASLHLIKLTPKKYNFLDSSLKKDGYSNRQEYIFVKGAM